MFIAAALALGACTAADGSDPGPAPSTSQVPDQQPGLLVVQVLNEVDYAIDNVLIGVPPQPAKRSPRLAYLPGSVLVPGESGEVSVTLGRTPQQPDTRAAVVALEAEFDLSIDGGLTLDRLAFAGLIDAVGGVWINVPNQLFIPRPEGELPLVVRSGWQRLNGITGADYATLRGPGEDESMTLQRFAAVFAETLRRLPATPERLRQLFTNLGSLAPSTTTTETLIDVFSQARAGMAEASDMQVFVEVALIRGGSSPASVVTERGSRTVRAMFADFKTEPVAVDVSSDDTTSVTR